MFKLVWRNTLRHPLRAALTVLGLAVAVLAALAPAWQAARVHIAAALRRVG